MSSAPVDREAFDGLEQVGENVQRVVPGVHAITLPLPDEGLRAINVYAVESETGITLIDGGWASADSLAALHSGLAVIGASPADIANVMVTHVHRDHYPQAAEIRRQYGSKVGLPVGERVNLTAIRSGTLRPLAPQLVQLRLSAEDALADRFWSKLADLEVDLAEWEEPDYWIREGLALDRGASALMAVPTPGHTQGHTCFTDLERGLLFAGDHVLPRITPSIGFEPVPRTLPLLDYLSSLARVRALPDLRLLPGHGPVTASSHARIDALVAHHDDRLAKCLDQLADGRTTAGEVARGLTWTRHDRRFEELNDFNQMLAVCETLAHLQLLVAQAKATRTVRAEVAYFTTRADDVDAIGG